MSTNPVPRVLHLISTLERAGAQSVLLGVAEALTGYHSTIAYLWGRGEALADIRLERVRVFDASRGGRPDPFVLPRLLRWARQERFDLVHTHLVHAGIVGGLLARQLSLPLVTTRHFAEHLKERSLLYRWETRMARSADRVIAVSGAVERHLAARGVSPQRIVVVPNGIDLRALAGAPPIARSRRRDRPVVGTVGRLDPQKGMDQVLEAVALLAARGREVDVEIVGAGPLDAKLRAQARSLGLEERVVFLGSLPRSAVLARVAGWDLFVLASRTEAFGVVLLEAMAAARAIVATRVEGIEEVTGDAARLVAPADPRALSAAVEALLADEGERRRLGRLAHQRVGDRFTIDATAAGYARVYDDVLGER